MKYLHKYSKFKIINILFIILLITFVVYIFGIKYIKYDKNLPRVAHAGGVISNIKYTNSVNAIINSIEKGFLYIEIDLNLTDDNFIVCSHEWGGDKNPLSFKYAPTYEDFKVHNNLLDYPQCDISNIINILDQYPNFKIVTDIKSNNLQVLEKVAKDYPKYINQLIPQIYHYDDINLVKRMGYKDIIFTLYKYKDKSNIHNGLFDGSDLYAFTMDAKTFFIYGKSIMRNFPNTPIYIHTINDLTSYCILINNGATEVYTDSLSLDINYQNCQTSFLQAFNS